MYATEQRHAVQIRHVDIAEQHIDIALFEFAQGGLTVGRSLHPIAQSLKFFL
jgi:hypothetical protein